MVEQGEGRGGAQCIYFRFRLFQMNMIRLSLLQLNYKPEEMLPPNPEVNFHFRSIRPEPDVKMNRIFFCKSNQPNLDFSTTDTFNRK